MWLYLDRHALGAALCALALVILTLSLPGQ